MNDVWVFIPQPHRENCFGRSFAGGAQNASSHERFCLALLRLSVIGQELPTPTILVVISLVKSLAPGQRNCLSFAKDQSRAPAPRLALVERLVVRRRTFWGVLILMLKWWQCGLTSSLPVGPIPARLQRRPPSARACPAGAENVLFLQPGFGVPPKSRWNLKKRHAYPRPSGDG